MKTLLPRGWPRPSGYSAGIEASGRLVFVSGQVGWDETGRFAEGLADQIAQALRNVVAVLAEAGAGPEHIARLTWYVVDKHDYVARRREIGEVYRATMGRNFPAMSVVEVSGLVEDAALVEIEATAVVAR